jgi:hypothetical protein
MARVETVFISDEVDVSLAFILANPNEDEYISNNFVRFLNDEGEADDDSIVLSRKWQRHYGKVLAFLEDIIIIDTDGKN